MPELVIVGAGGFGREVVDLVEAVNDRRAMSMEEPFDVLGFLDDGQPDKRLLLAYGLPHLGPVARLRDMPREVQYVVAIGAPAVRARLDAEIRGVGPGAPEGAGDRGSPVLVHPDATVCRQVRFGPGTVVCAGARLTNHITVGRHVHVNCNTTVGHDAVLGDHVTLSPQVAVSGNVTLHDRVMVGTAATLNPGVAVGEDAVVGSGAVVLRDVDASTTVTGVPARPRPSATRADVAHPTSARPLVSVRSST